jgi:hypothetical protein
MVDVGDQRNEDRAGLYRGHFSLKGIYCISVSTVSGYLLWRVYLDRVDRLDISIVM